MNGAEMDPRVMLAVTLIGLGVSTVEKIQELWRREGVDEEILAEIQVQVDKRLVIWQNMK